MAKFNKDIFDVDALSQHDKEMIGVYLEALITSEELKMLKSDWKEQGGINNIPLWKFAFDNIKVSYANEV